MLRGHLPVIRPGSYASMVHYFSSFTQRYLFSFQISDLKHLHFKNKTGIMKSE